MNVTAYHGSSQRVRQLLRELVRQLSGRGGSLPAEIIRGIQLRVGVALLSKVQLAYVEKARGGVGSDGVKWPKLKPETIARRKRTAQDIAAGKRAIKAALRSGQRKPTVVELYGNRQVEILIDTRELFRSLSPGLEDRAKVAAEMGIPAGEKGKGNAEQIFQTPPGGVIVGTNSKKAPTHQRGTQHVPARPMWPADGVLPRAWQQAVIQALQQGLMRAVVLLLERER